MNKAKPVGNILIVILIPFTLFASISFLSNPSAVGIVFAGIGMVGTGLVLYYRVSERRAMEFNKQNLDEYENGFDDTYQEPDQKGTSSDTVAICRECHTEISPGVKRCPNCGWKPKKRGGLWWGTTAVMSLNPIGWAMGAKGASDNYKASKGVAKEVQAKESDSDEGAATTKDQSTTSDTNPADALERINELKEQGIISEDEFEQKKKELLDQI